MRNADSAPFVVQHPTSISSLVRYFAFLPLSFVAPSLSVLYASTGLRWYAYHCAAFTPICGGMLLVFALSAPRESSYHHVIVVSKTKTAATSVPVRERRMRCIECLSRWLLDRERNLVLWLLLWFGCVATSLFVGDTFITTKDPMFPFSGILWLTSFFWAGLPITYCAVHIRRQLSKLPDEILSEYLFRNVCLTGLSSLATMLYLTLETLGVVSGAVRLGKFPSGIPYADDKLYTQLGPMLYAQLSNTWFLLSIMVLNMVIRPLTTTTLSKDQLLTMRLPLRVRTTLVLATISAVGNIYLYANRANRALEEGFLAVTLLSICFVAAALGLEIVSMIMFQINERFRRGSDDAAERYRRATDGAETTVNRGFSSSGASVRGRDLRTATFKEGNVDDEDDDDDLERGDKKHAAIEDAANRAMDDLTGGLSGMMLASAKNPMVTNGGGSRGLKKATLTTATPTTTTVATTTTTTAT